MSIIEKYTTATTTTTTTMCVYFDHVADFFSTLRYVFLPKYFAPLCITRVLVLN